MKKSASPLRIACPRKGFTMIELLTVIAVIGILASILIPAVGGARSTAMKSRLRAEFNQIAQACIMFKNDYGYWPKNGATSSFEDKEILDVLTGNAAGADVVGGNTRLIPYYSHANYTKDSTTPIAIDSAGNSDIKLVFSNARDRVPTIAYGTINAQLVSVGNTEDDGANRRSISPALEDDLRIAVAVFSAGDGKKVVGNWAD